MDWRDNYAKALEPEAKRRTYDSSQTGTVTFRVCPHCGSTRWSSSNKEPTDKLCVEVYEGSSYDSCSQCDFMRARHPEIAKWVMDVLTFSECRRESDGDDAEVVK